MVQLKNIKRWFWWHRWTSLICTLFLTVICLTGLPLIFQDEIEQWLSTDPPMAVLPKDTPSADIDHMISAASKLYPKQITQSVYIADDEPQTWVWMGPSMKAEDEKLSHAVIFDSRTGKLYREQKPAIQQPQTFMSLMLSLHTDLFAGLTGEMFLGLMGLLFVISIISGVVLYGPFMKKLDFGTIRHHKSRRLKWLDLHNLLGIATATWLLVVGTTGVMNELSTPLFSLWQATDVKAMLNQYKGKPVPEKKELSSVQVAYNTTKAALPGMIITSVVYPGDPNGSPYHYLLWAKGNTPLRSQLFTPVLVDARTGRLAAIVKMPTYLRALEVSRPLHFGNYGGTPLKILWALFDIVAIVVLLSGIYLWFDRRKLYAGYFKTLETNQESMPGKIDRNVWSAPLLLTVLILFGLVAALLGEGIWYALSWLALSIPLGIILWFLSKSKVSKRV